MSAKKKNKMPSTVIAEHQYFPETETLRIIYISGNVYDYLKVPADVYVEMKEVFSKGIFLNTRIKENISFRQYDEIYRLNLAQMFSRSAIPPLQNLLLLKYYFHSLGPLLLPPRTTHAAWLIDVKV